MSTYLDQLIKTVEAEAAEEQTHSKEQERIHRFASKRGNSSNRPSGTVPINACVMASSGSFDAATARTGMVSSGRRGRASYLNAAW